MTGIKFVGDIMAPSGYGNALRDLARTLVELDVPFFFQHIKHDRNAAKLDSFWAERMDRYLEPRPYDIIINSTTPEYYVIESGKKNIGWTFWETDRLPDFDYNGCPRHNWVKQMNRLDELWAPVSFVKNIAVEAGVKCPIHVVPWPCADKYLEAKPEVFRHKYIKDDDFVIGTVGQFTERKNFKDFVYALCSEFTQDEPVIGLIKTYAADDSPDQVRMVRDTLSAWKTGMNIPNACRFVGVHSVMSEDELLGVFQRMNLYVCTSRGEGMSGPLIHAMSLGKPVISTDFSAMADYIDEDSAFKVLSYTLEPVHSLLHIPWYGHGQNWARLDIMEIRRAMRAAYETWREDKDKYADYGSEARSCVQGLYTRDTVRDTLSDVLGLGDHSS